MKREESKKFTYARHVFQKSPIWKKFKEKLLEERGHYCELCGRFVPKGLALHHEYDYMKLVDGDDWSAALREYQDLEGHREDLMLVCKQCHTLLDRTSQDRLWCIANNFIERKKRLK